MSASAAASSGGNISGMIDSNIQRLIFRYVFVLLAFLGRDTKTNLVLERHFKTFWNNLNNAV